jgi:O-antigen/teichoic acid export membrane protein
MKIRQIISGTLWYGIVPKLSVFGYIVVLPLTTPFLTPLDFGLIGIISSYTTIVSSISTMGLHIHLPNSFYELKKNYKLLWRRLFFYFLVMGGIFSILLALVLNISIEDTGGHHKHLVILLAVLPIFFTASQQIAINYYVLIQKPQSLVSRNLIGSFLGIVAFYISARIFKAGYISWLISSVVSSVVIFLLFIPQLWLKEKLYPVFDITLRRIKYLFKLSLPVVPHSIGHTLLSSSDRIILSVLKIDINQIGFYSNGAQMSTHVRSIIDGLHTAMSPNMQVAYRANNTKEFRRYFLLSQSITSMLIFLASLWMKEIYFFLIRNEEMRSSFMIASILCFSFVSQSFYSFISLPVFIKKKTPSVLWLVFFPALLNIILNFIFIPLYGYMAAVVTTLISYWTIFFIPFFHPFYRQETILLLGKLSRLPLIPLGNILLLVVVFCFSETPILCKLVISTVSCLLVYFFGKKHFHNTAVNFTDNQ